MRLKGQNPLSSGANSSTKFVSPEAEISWERTMNMASQQQSQHPNTHAFPIPPPIRQEQRVFWHPGVTASGTTQRQNLESGTNTIPAHRKVKLDGCSK